MRGADACKEYIPLVSRHPISSCEYSDLIARPVFQLVSARYCRMVEVGMPARVYFERLDGDVLFSTSAHGRAQSRIGTRIRIHVFLVNRSVLALPSELSRAASGLDSCVNIPHNILPYCPTKPAHPHNASHRVVQRAPRLCVDVLLAGCNVSVSSRLHHKTLSDIRSARQILENIKQQSCESLALPFLFNWMLGTP